MLTRLLALLLVAVAVALSWSGGAAAYSKDRPCYVAPFRVVIIDGLAVQILAPSMNFYCDESAPRIRLVGILS